MSEPRQPRGDAEGPAVGNIFVLFLVRPQPDQTIEHVLSARYALHGGNVHVLEDRHGHLREVESGPLTPEKKGILTSFETAMYYAVERTDEVWSPTSSKRPGGSA